MERWDDLRVFLAAVRTGSCAAAGVQLGLNQSTVSRRLLALEESLGVRLFDRVPEGLLRLASADEILPQVEVAEAAIMEVGTAVAGLDANMKGVVRVALPELLAVELLAPRLPTLLGAHPGLAVELVAGDAVADLSRREADLALRFVRPRGGNSVVKRVATLRFGVYGSTPYLDRHRNVAPENLDWLDWDTTQAHLPDAAWLRTTYPQVEPVLRTTSPATRLRALRSGAGVSVLAQPLAAEHPELERLEGLPELPEFPVWLVGHRALRDLPRVKTVWSFLMEVCEELE